MSLIIGDNGETTETDWFSQVAVCLPVGSLFEGVLEPLLHVGLEAEAWAGNYREIKRQWCTGKEEV